MAAYINLKVAVQGVEQAVLGVQRLAGSIAKLTVATAAFVGVGMSIQKVMQGFGDAIDLGAELHDLSIQTGVAVSKLVVLKEAMRLTGVNGTNVGNVFNKLQNELETAGREGGSAADKFERLGLDVQNLLELRPDEQFQRISDAIRTLPTQTERSAAAMSLLGRGGGEFIRLFSDGNAMDQAKRNIGEFAKVLEQNAEAIDSIDDSLGRLKTLSQQFFVGVLIQIAEPLQKALDKIGTLDTLSWGKDVGAGIDAAIAAWNEGDLPDFIAGGLEYGFQQGMAAGVEMMDKIAKSEAVSKIAANIGIRFAESMGSAMVRVMAKNLKDFQLLYGILSQIHTMTMGVPLPPWEKTFGKIVDFMTGWEKGIHDAADDLTDTILNLTNSERVEKFLARIRASLSKTTPTGEGEGEPTGSSEITGRRKLDLVKQQRMWTGELNAIEAEIARRDSLWWTTSQKKYRDKVYYLETESGYLDRIINQLNEELKLERQLNRDPKRIETLETTVEQYQSKKAGVDNQRNAMGPSPDDLGQQAFDVMARWQERLGTWQQTVARGFSDIIGGAIDGVAEGIQGLLSMTMSWGDALRKIGTSIMNTVIQSISRMFAEWIAGMILKSAMTAILGKKDAAAQAPGALMTSISSYGTAAVIGTAALIAGLFALSAAFEKGGYTGSGDKHQVAGVVHKGEWVLTKDQVDAIGLHRLSAAFPTGAQTPQRVMLNAPSPEVSTQVKIAAFDNRIDAREWANTQEAETWFVDMSRRTLHQWGRA